MTNKTKYPDVTIVGGRCAGKTVILVGLLQYLRANATGLGVVNVRGSHEIEKQLERINNRTDPTEANAGPTKEDVKDKKFDGSLSAFSESVELNIKTGPRKGQKLSIVSFDGGEFTAQVGLTGRS